MDGPVFVLGAARSGTTLVAEHLLGEHSKLVYIGEPKFVWRAGNAYRLTDVFPPCAASAGVKKRIRRAFERRRRQGNGERILEKTPENVLRLPFVAKIFPDAQIVHVIRDGRDAVVSARYEWSGKAGGSLDSQSVRVGTRWGRFIRGLFKDLRLGERVFDAVSVLELPSYLPKFAWYIARRGFGCNLVPWGPRVPGIWSARWSIGLLEACALQWDICVRLGRNCGEKLAAEQYMEVRYEELIQRPHEALKEICGFLGLETSEDWLAGVTECVRESRAGRWEEELQEEEVIRIENVIGSSLKECGYRQ